MSLRAPSITAGLSPIVRRDLRHAVQDKSVHRLEENKSDTVTGEERTSNPKSVHKWIHSDKSDH
jgi:hypothetical protein